MKKPDSTEKLQKDHVQSGVHVREDSEYVRLVIHEIKPEVDAIESEPQVKRCSLLWWIKAASWCLITIIALLMFVKWGVPFLVEKVISPCFDISYCHATTGN